jgi:hypothetical protein
MLFFSVEISVSSYMFPFTLKLASLLCTLTFIFSHGLLAQDADSSPVPSRAELIREVSKMRGELQQRGFQVGYSVNQTFVAEDCAFSGVHVGGTMDPGKVLSFWWAEHAYSDARYFHLTSDQQLKLDADRYQHSHVRSDGAVILVVAGGRKIAEFRGIDSAQSKIPIDEELYREIIGFESSRQDLKTTLRGFRSPEPYDLLSVLESAEYTIHKADEALGEDVIVIEKTGVEKVWLDRARGCAILQYERWSENSSELSVQIKNSDFEKLGDSVWLPKKCDVFYYGNEGSGCSGQVAVHSTLTVDHISLDPPDMLFDLDREKVTAVVAVEKGQGSIDSSILVDLESSKGQDLKKFVESKLEPQETNSARTFLWISIAVGLLVVGCFTLFWYVRTRR